MTVWSRLPGEEQVCCELSGRWCDRLANDAPVGLSGGFVADDDVNVGVNFRK